ncbi:MAG: UDP-glucose 4-epimerase GalE [Propionicimonas sp.]|nr:UDP-glucose 4-epimerase GalE [Propionicimonas sp.]
MRVLATGGAGYIGSHTLVELLDAGHDVHVVDDLSNSSVEALARVRGITGKPVGFTQANLRDEDALEQLFTDFAPEAVIHFAGLKAVGESVAQPLRYYHENVGGSIALVRVMDRHDCRTIVFSSSATVYGVASEPPFVEDAPVAATNPYGQTKAMIEQILSDVAATGGWRVALLRYFNPVGAHPSGRIGEDPAGIPNNLFPYVAQVASGRLEALQVFGDDYDTPDGTGVRDYIHVCDLARGHLAALEALAEGEGCRVWNLGTGVGASVLEVLAAWSAVVGRELPYRVVARRSGDVAVSLADPAKAQRELGWRSTRTLADMCRDHWVWQSANPRGYRA